MFKLAKKLTKKDVLFFLFSIVFIVLNVWLELKIPDYMSEITVLVQTEGSLMSDILKEGIFMLLCALGSLATAVVVGYLAAHIGSSYAKTLRKSIFNKVGEFSAAEIKSFSTSSLITRTTNDIRQVRMFIVMGIQMLIKAPIMAIIALSKIANKGIEFSIITAVGVVIVLILITILIIVVLPKFKIIQTLTDNLNRITRENLTGIRVVRAYNAEEYQNARFEKANSELTETNLFTQKAMAIMSPVMSTIMSSVSLAIYWVGTYLINEAAMLDKIEIFSNMVVFSSYAIQVIMSFMMLVILFIIYPRASVSAKRINEVLETEPMIKDGQIASDTTKLKGVVEFKNVSFKYPDAEDYILKDISFKANQGETVAFIGTTGSGKSTLINLIPRFYDATDGEVLIDGVNVREMNLEYLNNKIGYVSQKAILFKGSIKENISFGVSKKGKPALKKIKEAIKIAQGEDFVLNMPEKYNSEIAQSGTNISGGQKQRLSIARAIAREPEIYIFDDAFSALDYKTDYNLRKELNKYTKDATKFIVAQRIGTIKDADKIVVLDSGKCVGIGTHEELLKNCRVYQEIVSSQFGKEAI
ncbi:MAG: ABC transporter ATP-binding protein [Bacilli bacterium]|nr:ABC transporter ATP-binding protein [Bacilli bacterium]